MAKRMMYCWLSTPLSTAKQRFNIKTAPSYSRPVLASARAERSISTASKKKKRKERNKSVEELVVVKNDKEKRRTRSEKEYEELHSFHQTESHVPVMLGEVVDVFSSLPLRSFIDCTLGAAGHSSAIIKGHPELECYIGMDVDPVAHAKARAHIDALLQSTRSSLKPHLLFKNFKYIKSVVSEIDDDCKLLSSGVDGILMDLGMSSMQVNNPQRGFSVLANGPLDMRMDPRVLALIKPPLGHVIMFIVNNTLSSSKLQIDYLLFYWYVEGKSAKTELASVKAKDILNYWPDDELGRILREYGEESNWRWLQKKIVQARQQGGLHSTGELRDLIQGATHGTKGGRQGWIKTATRVFQALRIAVNDELNTLEKSLHACFECLVPGGRLAVISFHSLEDRIVKQTFLKIIESNGGDGDVVEEEAGKRDLRKMRNDIDAKETWIRQMVQGQNGTILTKRPITPSEEEERLNRRSRSAKLRVIEKIR
ncbi:ribosomal RNA small subunit methyltransferase H [Populus alba x Populus x berolinensis]|uniref:Ribosomal RNA small subunit methyltransferase H n=1 Tax=Populus alba x Populus x berolinensis TaxID=444605 RepID=A0AAD6QXR0_9ROSI|nr:ribosomal RNA small subunit methyltransferase H [Populus alba x Populus x berolinensis]